MVGEDEQAAQYAECTYPMENGMVRSWEDMQQHVWDYTFHEKMKMDPKEY